MKKTHSRPWGLLLLPGETRLRWEFERMRQKTILRSYIEYLGSMY